eukprot:scaffold40651_cov63-Phaeocystis_antarctica.AAC.2
MAGLHIRAKHAATAGHPAVRRPPRRQGESALVPPLDKVPLGIAHVEGDEEVGAVVGLLAHEGQGARGALFDLGKLVRIIRAVVEAAGVWAEDEDVTAVLLLEVDLEHLTLRALPPLLLQALPHELALLDTRPVGHSRLHEGVLGRDVRGPRVLVAAHAANEGHVVSALVAVDGGAPAEREAWEDADQKAWGSGDNMLSLSIEARLRCLRSSSSRCCVVNSMRSSSCRRSLCRSCAAAISSSASRSWSWRRECSAVSCVMRATIRSAVSSRSASAMLSLSRAVLASVLRYSHDLYIRASVGGVGLPGLNQDLII